MNTIIEEIYQTGLVHDELGNEYQLQYHLNRSGGEKLSDLISSDDDIHKTLEIGCAFGLSSLYICSALSIRESPKHIIIDPFQYSHFHGVGITNLKRAGFNFFELIEKPSEIVLPELVQNEAGSFDMVFVDGWHTFDHTLLDLFYANRLIRLGAYIVVDDCLFPSVAKAVSYVSQYPAYQILSHPDGGAHQGEDIVSFKMKLGSIVKSIIPPSIAGYLIPRYFYDRFYIRLLYSRMVVLRKVEEDKRGWDWFRSF